MDGTAWDWRASWPTFSSELGRFIGGWRRVPPGKCIRPLLVAAFDNQKKFSRLELQGARGAQSLPRVFFFFLPRAHFPSRHQFPTPRPPPPLPFLLLRIPPLPPPLPLIRTPLFQLFRRLPSSSFPSPSILFLSSHPPPPHLSQPSSFLTPNMTFDSARRNPWPAQTALPQVPESSTSRWKQAPSGDRRKRLTVQRRQTSSVPDQDAIGSYIRSSPPPSPSVFAVATGLPQSTASAPSPSYTSD